MSLRDAFGTDVLVTGWGHTRFGNLDDESLESLIVSAAAEALACAGVEPGQIDEIYLGQFNSGMMPLGFPSSLALQVSDDLANVPATRVENACASGSAAFQQGIKSILAGTARTVLVIGAEKMTHAPADVVGAALLGADYEHGREAHPPRASPGSSPTSPSTTRSATARPGSATSSASIAAKNHRNGVANPYAQLRKDLGEDFCRTVSDRNPDRRRPAAPHRLLTRVRRRRRPRALDVAPPAAPPTRCGSPASATPTTSSRRQARPTAFAATTAAWQRALGMAGVDARGPRLRRGPRLLHHRRAARSTRPWA